MTKEQTDTLAKATKSGIQTSEFYTTILGYIAAILVVGLTFVSDLGGQFSEVAKGSVAVVGTIAINFLGSKYTDGRTRVKEWILKMLSAANGQPPPK